MTEAQLKRTCTKRLTAAGWLVIHLIQTNCNGITDTLILRAGRYIWIEFKIPGAQPRQLQAYRIKKLNEQGAETRVVHYEHDITDLL